MSQVLDEYGNAFVSFFFLKGFKTFLRHSRIIFPRKVLILSSVQHNSFFDMGWLWKNSLQFRKGQRFQKCHRKATKIQIFALVLQKREKQQSSTFWHILHVNLTDEHQLCRPVKIFFYSSLAKNTRKLIKKLTEILGLAKRNCFVVFGQIKSGTQNPFSIRKK